jgi:hypothetical protein
MVKVKAVKTTKVVKAKAVRKNSSAAAAEVMKFFVLPQRRKMEPSKLVVSS